MINKLYLSNLDDKPYKIKEKLEFDVSANKLNYLESLNNVYIDVCIYKVGEDLINLDFEISGQAILLSAINLDKVPYQIKIKEKIFLTTDESLQDENIIYHKDNFIDLNDLAYSYIIADLPYNIHSQKDKTNIVKDGYRIISQQQYEEEQKKKPSPFDKLKDLDL